MVDEWAQRALYGYLLVQRSGIRGYLHTFCQLWLATVLETKEGWHGRAEYVEIEDTDA